MQQLRPCLRQIANRSPVHLIPAGLRQPDQQLRTGIARRIQRMAEPRHAFSTAQTACHHGPGAPRCLSLRNERKHPLRGSPVLVAFQRRHRGRDDIIGRGAGRRCAPGGKRRNVQFVVRAQDQRRSNHVGDRIALRRPGGLYCPVNGRPRVAPGDDCRQQPDDASPCLPDRCRAQIVGRQVSCGGDRQSGLKPSERLLRAGPQLRQLARSQSAGLVESPLLIGPFRGPQQRRDFFQHSMSPRASPHRGRDSRTFRCG